ncbi:hypothetical protein FJSC11DRAFT_2433 [Fischerella thermalis JSC-11]|uniref:Uncharacterized protein n=1 Tax=Fischerella thermalis JSC-11 TaxID=741277 RepID=G6FU86_9CYAN|nr:hypothetical protein FJSC11DRAFT_2433 [Fischerella thermalis JSC-11]
MLLIISAFVPRKWGNYSQYNCDMQICVFNTGIHTNIILPTKIIFLIGINLYYRHSTFLIKSAIAYIQILNINQIC